MNHLPRDKEGHNFEPGQCRHAARPGRDYAPRRGHHPRDPARPAEDSPTAGLPGHAREPGLGEWRELGADGEREAIERVDAAVAASGGHQAEGGGQPAEGGHQADSGGAASSSGAAPGRGPDREPRVRRTWNDTGAGPEAGSEWTTFDIGRTVRALKVCTPA